MAPGSQLSDHVHVVLYCVDEILKRTNEMKATDQYFSAVLFMNSLAFLKVIHIEGW